MSAPDVVVVGAGITGAVASHALVEAGAQVEVIDAYGPAAMASGWTLAGVRQSGRDPAELPLALEAVRRWPHLDGILGAPTHYRQDGNLRLARTEAEVATIRRLVETQMAAGLDLKLLPDNAAVRAVVPALSDRILAASFCPSDGRADPVATVHAFLTAAERGGARVVGGERVVELVYKGGRVTGVRTSTRVLPAGAVILASGIETNALLERLGVAIPLTVPIVTVIRTTPVAPLLRPVLGVANANLAVRQEVSGALRFTSGAEPFGRPLDEENGRPVARPRAGNVMETIARVGDVLPDIAGLEIAAMWGGLLDLTPDALPVIDRVPGLDNLVVAAGFSGHGFGIGPVTGELAADLVLGRTPGLPLDAFRFDRFSSAPVSAPAELTLHG
ncbi:MAG: FAD-binding oxidoreductase [Pseudomonadota bacterium]